MCGRYTLTKKPQWNLEAVGLTEDRTISSIPRYNMAPTQVGLVLSKEEDGYKWSGMSWGLKSSFQGTTKLLINSRSETAHETKRFRHLVNQHRCLVPADGYFEWSEKQPFRIILPGEPIFALGGICEPSEFKPTESSFVIFTMEANEPIRHLHHRMPCLIPEPLWSDWLGGTPWVEMLQKVHAAPSPSWKYYPVSKAVNQVRTDSPECIEPFDPGESPQQLELF